MIEGIYPRGGPRAGAPDSETDVYRALEESLPAGWVAWHSLTLRVPGRGDCEMDFVVAHPELGGVVVEAKGGRISIINGGWRNNGRPMRRDPLGQVYAARSGLVERARSEGLYLPSLTVALAFPDTDGDGPRGSGALDGRVVTKTHLEGIGARLAWLLERDQDERYRPTPGWMEWLHQLWTDAWVPTLRPSARIDADEKDRVKLDERQHLLLELLELNPRVLVEGVAGTGKSLLAVEAARRRERLGKRVLLCCFTRALAATLRRDLADTSVEVWTVREFALEILREAGKAIDEPTNEQWETIASHTVETIDALPDFDTVVVDEAQDLSLGEWELITALADERRLWAFTDEGQGFWEDRPLARNAFSTKARLGASYRTPEPLFEVAASCLAQEPEPEWLALARENGRIHWLEVTEKKSAPAIIREDIRRQTRDGVDPSDIAILSLRGKGYQGALAWIERGKLDVVGADDDAADEKIVADTFLRFKGLERPVIYVCDLGAVTGKRGVRLYVALTRALTEARIVATREELDAVPELRGLLDENVRG